MNATLFISIHSKCFYNKSEILFVHIEITSPFLLSSKIYIMGFQLFLRILHEPGSFWVRRGSNTTQNRHLANKIILLTQVRQRLIWTTPIRFTGVSICYFIAITMHISVIPLQASQKSYIRHITSAIVRTIVSIHVLVPLL